jgi:hypothetical protein
VNVEAENFIQIDFKELLDLMKPTAVELVEITRSNNGEFALYTSSRYQREGKGREKG